jgi:hypothetical protein
VLVASIIRGIRQTTRRNIPEDSHLGSWSAGRLWAVYVLLLRSCWPAMPQTECPSSGRLLPWTPAAGGAAVSCMHILPCQSEESGGFVASIMSFTAKSTQRISIKFRIDGLHWKLHVLTT